MTTSTTAPSSTLPAPGPVTRDASPSPRTRTTTAGATAEADQAVATLVVAFASDPVMRWMYPDSARYLGHFPELVRLLGDEAFVAGTADRTEGGKGAALWVPPEAELPDDELVGFVERSIDPERHDVAFTFLAQVEEQRPIAPHWYLPFIGVDPRDQGRGHGTSLLRTGLARCDRDTLPAYLEASSPRNRALYERHGFEVVAEIRAGDSPPLWPMSRQPR
jgi:ribosomal protein S18 acetylase RimI-like enzyme